MQEIARFGESAAAAAPTVKPDARFSLLLQAFAALQTDESPGPVSATEHLRAVLFSLSHLDTRRHKENLEAFGFDIVACHDIGALGNAVLAGKTPLIALLSPAEAVHLAVAQVRLRHPQAGIVAMAEFPDSVSKVSSLLSGADSCIDMQSDSLELAASLLALNRRLRLDTVCAEPVPLGVDPIQADSASAGRGWRLVNDGWNLVAPNDSVLALNVSERQLLIELLGSPGKQLKRLDGDKQALGGSDPSNSIKRRSRRNLDLIISRLRRKAAAQDIDLPIRSVRGEGYVFAADHVDDAASRSSAQDAGRGCA
ncbi:two-component response regulator [Bordetella ansorpii]|uniref:Two-component response regulator n=1 Tax=Bordetella ansorpii TaxID=288768 RepID=A0A146AWL7_9BORD|nr:helix-turn-helix domain-containing protein [Bordetella ansorpii]CZZ94281.1 two-component response regulator [Bordetella ansorpii]